MMRIALALATAAVFVGPVLAQTDKAHSDKERKEDVARHRALAAVHEAAAKCLEAGKPEKDCLAQLAKDCKGLGIGKYCGMKHRH
jgi:hypothetical protein